MRYRTPRTLVDGQPALYAAWNQDVRDAIAWLHDPPSCRIYVPADISIRTNEAVDVPFGAQRWDTDGMHSITSSPEKVMIQTTGKYRIGACVQWDDQTVYAGVREVGIKLNDDKLIVVEDEFGVVGATFTNAQTIMQAVSTIWHCRGADLYDDPDVLSLQVFHTAGESVSIVPTSTRTPTLQSSAEMWVQWRSG